MAQNRKFVLLVEDEPDIRELVKEVILSVDPYAMVVEAPDGAEGILKGARQKFNLVITDMKMPKKDGTFVLETLVNALPDYRPDSILVLSGHSKESEICERYPKFNVQFLGKPCSTQVLTAMVKKCLDGECSLMGGAARAPESSSTKVPAQVLSEVLESVLGVLKEKYALAATRQELFIKKDSKAFGECSSVTSLKGSSFDGTLGISYSKECLAYLSGALKTDPSQAAKELAGAIVLNAAKRLHAAGIDLDASAVGAVTVGSGHQIKHASGVTCIAIRFKSDHGPFEVEVSVLPAASAARSA